MILKTQLCAFRKTVKYCIFIVRMLLKNCKKQSFIHLIIPEKLYQWGKNNFRTFYMYIYFTQIKLQYSKKKIIIKFNINKHFVQKKKMYKYTNTIQLKMYVFVFKEL